METELLARWRTVLQDMIGHQGLEQQALAENEWFNFPNVRSAMIAMLPWWDAQKLSELRSRYPAIGSPQRIGLILAGNLPLVGLHDMLMVLLSGHHAVVKPSHKDGVLLRHLLAHSPAALQARIRLVTEIKPADVDFLIATGSNATARQIAETFVDTPKLIRQNRFSVAVLTGRETVGFQGELDGLSMDITMLHGMGCRSVSALLVPVGYDLAALIKHIDRFAPEWFTKEWTSILRYERALQQTLGHAMPNCKYFVFEQAAQVKPGRIGVVQVIAYASQEHLQSLLAPVRDQIQCIVGDGGIPFGQAQRPGLEDFADGVDTLALLTDLPKVAGR